MTLRETLEVAGEHAKPAATESPSAQNFESLPAVIEIRAIQAEYRARGIRVGAALFNAGSPSPNERLRERLTQREIGEMPLNRLNAMCDDEFEQCPDLQATFKTADAYRLHVVKSTPEKVEVPSMDASTRDKLLSMPPDRFRAHCASEFNANPELQSAFRTLEAYQAYVAGQATRGI